MEQWIGAESDNSPPEHQINHMKTKTIVQITRNRFILSSGLIMRDIRCKALEKSLWLIIQMLSSAPCSTCRDDRVVLHHDRESPGFYTVTGGCSSDDGMLQRFG
jgi:hypothetical protein